ncbi:MAG: Fic family protein [Bacteriovoracales bacterium]|nr:Fic family protein [Bacteriovoracales bacterium]
MVAKFKSGTFITQYQYKSFRPTYINRPFQMSDADIGIALEKASQLLGELNAYSKLIPNIDFFIQMHITREATDSSKIEGTKTELDEALLEEDDIDPQKRDDWWEVRNYIKAMNSSISKLEKLPLSIRLLKETHKILLSDVRGGKKCPGEIRTSQNWIGGTNLKDAAFIPPHQNDLPELLSDLENFFHNSTHKNLELVKAAIIHYQFETIHPFLDGNGRIGRLLIILYLIDKKILSKPVLYLSSFFAKHKGQYYDALTQVRTQNNLKHWILFFLSGVIETAQSSIDIFQKIIKLREECEKKNLNLGKRAKTGKQLLKYMYSNPVFNTKKSAKFLEIKHQTVNSLIEKFVELGILKEITGYKRNRIFVFASYLDLFKYAD